MIQFFVNSNVTRVEGRYGILMRWLRVRNEEAQYSASYNAGLWDGYTCFFDSERKEFPTGFLPSILKKLDLRKRKYEVQYSYSIPTTERLTNASFLNDIKLRPYQLKAINACLRNKHGRGIIDSVTGSGKTAIMASIAGKLSLDHDAKTIVLVSRKGLLYQTREDFETLLCVPVGMVGDGKRMLDANIVIATPQSLVAALPEEESDLYGVKTRCRKQEPRLLNLIRQSSCLLIDEAQHASSNTVYRLGLLSPAVWRFAFSGTPLKNKRWEDFCLYGLTGKRLHTVSGHSLVKKDVLAEPRIIVIRDPSIYGGRGVSHVPYNTVFSRMLSTNRAYNNAVAYIAKKLCRLNKPPIVFTHRIEHVKSMRRQFDKLGVAYEVLTGDTPMTVRNDVKKRYTNGENFALIVSSIFDEGENVPNAASLIFAGGGKSVVNVRQRLGRGMRKKEDNRVWVIDFDHSPAPMLFRHYEERIKIYQKEKYSIYPVSNIRSVKKWLNV